MLARNSRFSLVFEVRNCRIIHSLTGASCFRPVRTFKKLSQNVSLDDCIMFQAWLVWHAERSSFEERIVFQVCFDRLYACRNLIIWRELRASGVFWHASIYQQTNILTTASCFRPVLKGCEIGTIAEFDESCVSGWFWPIKNYENTLFLLTASGFRLVLRGCEIDTIAEFDESFAFQADFDPSKTMKKT